MDGIYIGTPNWLEVLFESLEMEVSEDLKKYSPYYRQLNQQIDQVYSEYPDFARILEHEERQNPMNLSEEKVKILSDLIETQIQMEEMRKRLFYCRGCRDGLKYAQYAGIIVRDAKSGMENIDTGRAKVW